MTIPAGTLVPRDARDFGSYELIAKLATGGMAEIFLARAQSAQSAGPKGKVVLKRILPHLAEDEHFVTMFRDEANLASRLIHANVCRVHGLGHHGGTWFIVMEYLHGVALSRMLSRLAKKHQFVDFRIIAGLVVQACEGLHHAHELRDADGHLLNVVHRDVSPPNIMLCADGLVKLLDFGIAKARGANSKTRTGTVKGKNAYMSPEQILGKPLDRRSDVFALGCVMYELIAVKRLFHRDSDFLTFKAITEEPIPDIRDRRRDIPLPLRAALTQALSRDPAGRFATARAFSEAVKDALAPLGGPATAVELKKFLLASFGDELVARDELLKAADDPDAIPSGPMPGTGSGSAEIALRSTDPSATRRPVSATGSTDELETVDGELLVTDERKRIGDRAMDQSPSMIIGGAQIGPNAHTPPGLRIPGAPGARSRPKTDPPPVPGFGGATPPGRIPSTARIPVMPPPSPTPAYGTTQPIGTAPTPALGVVSSPDYTPPTGPGIFPMPAGISGSGSAAAAGASVVGFDDPSDLLRGHRRKSMLRALVAIGAVAGLALLVVLVKCAGSEPRKRPVIVTDVDAAPAVDARPAPPDADMRSDIEKFSRFGYLNLSANKQTTVYIDDKVVGPAPLTRWPLAPGIHEVKVVGPPPHGSKKPQSRKFEVTLYGGKDTDAPPIEWK